MVDAKEEVDALLEQANDETYVEEREDEVDEAIVAAKDVDQVDEAAEEVGNLVPM